MARDISISLLPYTNEDGAMELAIRISNVMRQNDILNRGTPVTISCGIARLLTEDDMKSLLIRADEALYQAKAQGRDRIVLHPCHATE